ncbi:reprolysin-like metallopeptidase [Mariniflexile ostreae]|uniref:Reprolysin-like metallopeptidase n=1 Tax=Mariniflexile ostreae TaxID=1520892 RepID=A0ABV5FB56_9FLAO
MKQLNLKFLLLLLSIACLSLTSFAQHTNPLWTVTTQKQTVKRENDFRQGFSNKNRLYQLDIEQLTARLQLASRPSNGSKASSQIITFPNADGTIGSYTVIETPILEPVFQAEQNHIRSYAGHNIENPETTIHFSLTPKGLHAMTLSPANGTQFIDPYNSSSNTYTVYNKTDLPTLKEFPKCLTPDYATTLNPSNNLSKSAKTMGDGKLRTFRLALASTAEYASFHIDAAGLSNATMAQKKQAVLEAMVVTMTRVNAIFKRDLSLVMSLVNNMDIIFLDEEDGFSNFDASALIDESQTIINTTIGAANYDIGHTFSTGAGGIAELSSVCNNHAKARGVTGQPFPVGDAYNIDFVTHEMGHQFGAPHTWNGNAGNCDTLEWNSSNAYEPGSGSTIMAYAGICAPQNIQSYADAYFHQKSIQMIWNTITTGSSTCGTESSTFNSPPKANAGSSYTIPISTPYKLTGSSTDTEGTDTHTYTWEQYDLGGGASRGVPNESNASGPLVRSFEGTTSPIRYIPRLEDLRLSNGSTTWEKLASVSRPINFQLTVRDHDIRGGQTATDNMTVSTYADAGPFKITSQQSYVSYPENSTQTITWDVAKTNASPVNTSLVNILLSTDGGLTFPTVLVANTANDGTANISFPNDIKAPFCRIMVEAVNNIFFAINPENFAIGYNVSTTCTQYTGGTDLPLNIPDNGDAFVSSTISVNESTTITDVKVGLNIDHTYQGDLQIALQSPNSTQTNLITPNLCGNGSLIIRLDDNANPIDCSNAQNNDVYRPLNPLSIFKGENPFGNWTLGIADLSAGDTGILTSWYLELCTTTITEGSPEPIAFADLKVFPNPNSGDFIVTLTNLIKHKIDIVIYDTSGRIIFKKDYENNGVFNETIKLSSISSGMYILKARDGTRTYTRKIMIN